MSPTEILIALQTILKKELVRVFRIWMQTLLPPAITMTLYFIIFGKLIGPRIGTIHSYTYMQYIVPGLVMMSMMTSAYANTSSSFFGSKFNKSIEEMLVSPMPNVVVLLGFTLGGVVRGLMVGLIVILISLFFTHLHIFNLSLVIAMALLATCIFSLAGLINGIFAKKFDDVSFIPTFVLTPLTYLGGVFYSIKQLPLFWQKISIINPVFAIVDTFRYGVLGISDIHVVFGVILSITLFFFLILWALFLLEKGVGLKT